MRPYILVSIVSVAIVSIVQTASPAIAQPELKIAKGLIQGTLIYPSEVLRAQEVCAVNTQSQQRSCVETKQDQRTFSIEVQPGSYVVFSQACNKTYKVDVLCSDGYLKKRAYYNEYVRCGLTYQCSKSVKVKTPISIRVQPGKIIKGIKPQDWYHN
jgi:hypothetical protein